VQRVEPGALVRELEEVKELISGRRRKGVPHNEHKNINEQAESFSV
jgi:hypothetical protein